MAQNNQIFKDGDILYAEDLNKIKSSLDDKAAVYIQNSAPLEAEDGDIWYYKDDELKTSKIYIRKNSVWNEINTVPTYDEKNYGQVLSPSPSGLTWSKKNDLPLEKSNDSSIRHSSSVPSSDTLEGYHLGKNAFSLGKNSKSTGDGSFSLGENSTTTGPNSVAEGLNTEVSGIASHAEGQGTKASGNAQHVEGKYNIEDSTKAHIVGNGESDAKRSNIHTLDWKGKAWFSDDVLIGGTKSEDAPISLKKIAQNGGGGGGGTSDWNQNDPYGNGYIRNRPFYEEPVTEKQIIIPKSTYDFVDSQETNKIFMNRDISKACFIRENDNVTVFYDGVEYSNIDSIIVKKQLIVSKNLESGIPNIYLDFLCYGNSKAFFENYSPDQYSTEPFFNTTEGLKTNHPFFIIIPIEVEVEEIENPEPLILQQIPQLFSMYKFFGLCSPGGSPGTHTIAINVQKITSNIHYLNEKFIYNSDWDANKNEHGFIKNKPCERKLIETESKLLIPDQTENYTTFLSGKILSFIYGKELGIQIKTDPFTIATVMLNSYDGTLLNINENKEQVYDLIIKAPSKNQLIIKKFENLPITKIPLSVIEPEFMLYPQSDLLKIPVIGNISSILKFMKNIFNSSAAPPEIEPIMFKWNSLVDEIIDSLNISCEQPVGAIMIPDLGSNMLTILGILDDDPIYFALNPVEGVDEAPKYMSFNIIEHTNDYTYKKINKRYIGTPDWDCFDHNSNNFIENKPFYKEPTGEYEEKILIPETIIEGFEKIQPPGTQDFAYMNTPYQLNEDICGEDIPYLFVTLTDSSQQTTEDYTLINVLQDSKKYPQLLGTISIMAAGYTEVLALALKDTIGKNINIEDYALKDPNQQSFGIIVLTIKGIDQDTSEKITVSNIFIYTTLPGTSHGIQIGTIGEKYTYHPIPSEYLDLTEITKALSFPGQKDSTEPTGEIFNDYINNQSKGLYSHAQGYDTQALSDCQSVSGKYNITDDLNKYSHIIGNGSSSQRSNSLTLNWNGTLWCANDIKIGGLSDEDPQAYSLKENQGNFSLVSVLPEKTEKNFEKKKLYLNNNQIHFYDYDKNSFIQESKTSYNNRIAPIFYYYLNKKIYILSSEENSMIIYDCELDNYKTYNQGIPVKKDGCALYYFNEENNTNHILYFSTDPNIIIYDWNLSSSTSDFDFSSTTIDFGAGIRKASCVYNSNADTFLLLGGEIYNTNNSTWETNTGVWEYDAYYEEFSLTSISVPTDGIGLNVKCFNDGYIQYYLYKNNIYKRDFHISDNFIKMNDIYYSDTFDIDYKNNTIWFLNKRYFQINIIDLKTWKFIKSLSFNSIPYIDQFLIKPDQGLYLLCPESLYYFHLKYLSYPIKDNILSTAEGLISGKAKKSITNDSSNIFPEDKEIKSIAIGLSNKIYNSHSIAQGFKCTIGTDDSSADSSVGQYSHAEGMETVSIGEGTHSEGNHTKAYGFCNHAEGEYTQAGKYLNTDIKAAHAEGLSTRALDWGSHAEGCNNIANSIGAHAEGYGTKANARYSHTEGDNTIAEKEFQKVLGSYNIPDTISSIIIGNGTGGEQRSNSFTLNDKGIGWFSKDIYLGGLSSEDSKSISILDYLSKLDAQITYNSMKDKTLLPIEKNELVTKLSKWYSLGIWTKEMVQEAINLGYITNEDSQIIYTGLTPEEYSESISTSISESTSTSESESISESTSISESESISISESESILDSISVSESELIPTSNSESTPTSML